ncbi:hypothetical protein XI04_16270 [Bradyrhizobium sp. CCBAU 11430]|nr:hypothetical protein [Bradyrhizobium sp. CCBAU 21360]MDA9456895.1 hypothetical protein [Bradyrhizobium sp. CCBAU 21359]MDA9514600.1 hypothetical protein [Bradyrhizobium sp. CCBAU 11430]
MVLADSYCHIDKFFGDLTLLGFHPIPEFILDDAKLWNFGDDPVGLRIETRDAFPRRRILNVMQPIPNEASHVKLVIDDPGAALDMAPDRRVIPQLGLRAGYAFGVELHRDRSRTDASGEVPKDAPDYAGLGRIDLSVSPDTISALVEPFDNAVSVAKPAT